MAAKPKDDYDAPAKIKVRPHVYKRIVEVCAEPRKATPELKAFLARGKALLKGD